VEPMSTKSIRVNAQSLWSGLYFVRVRGETFVATRKLMIAK